MINVTLDRRTIINYDNVGAIICHTPKTLFESESGEISTTQSCRLISTLDELEKYFGDPFIDPTVYSDLIIARDIISRGTPLYISSVYEMKDNKDVFTKVFYNGYTEFYFKENDYDVVGYKLKSDIKFCQPIISNMYLSNEKNQLHIYVHLYHLDRGMTRSPQTLDSPEITSLYKVIHFVFNADSVKDINIINDFNNNGLEMHLIYADENDAGSTLLVDQLKKHATNGFKVLLNSLENNNEDDEEIVSDKDDDKYDDVDNYFYHYKINSSDYSYNISKEDDYTTAYVNAIDALKSMLREPTMLCMGRMFQSIDTEDTEGKKIKLLSSRLEPLNPESQFGIYSVLLDAFDEECNTYLYINMPDLSASTSVDLLKQENAFSSGIVRLQEHYNCDLFFGYATDIINTSLMTESPRKVFYSSALLSFYSLILSGDKYLTNNFIGLNISNRCVKSVLSESSAKKLQNERCNSMVLFDIGSPSVYGDRSLSLLPNLRYSHISRNFVAIRRLIRYYLETKKFTLNTTYNIDSYICYIKFNILDDFVSKGVLSNYSVSYTKERQSVFIQVILIFESVAESIDLSFSI